MVFLKFRYKWRRKWPSLPPNQHENVQEKLEVHDLPCVGRTASVDETQRDDMTTTSTSTMSPNCPPLFDDVRCIIQSDAIPNTESSDLSLSFPESFLDAQSVLRVMRMQESTIYNQRRHELDELRALWRKTLVEWMYFVVDSMKKNRQSVAPASYFLDVAMATDFVNTREEHQLAAATSLQLALKAYDCASIEMKKLLQLGRGIFNDDDLVEMEFKLLKALDWYLHPPSTYCFLHQYEKLMPSSVSQVSRLMIASVTKLVSEITVCDQKYNKFPPSVAAYACILMAMEFIEGADLPIRQRHCFIMNMAFLAEIQSSSSLVLKVFEELKRSLDNSPKLQELIESVAATRRMGSKVVPRSSSQSRHKRSVHRSSPRYVSAELEQN